MAELNDLQQIPLLSELHVKEQEQIAALLQKRR